MSPRGLAAAAAAVVLLAACGERVIVYKQGEYQGKPDTAPWDNAPPQNSPQVLAWQKGDQKSWEQSIKARTLAQNEYARMKNK